MRDSLRAYMSSCAGKLVVTNCPNCLREFEIRQYPQNISLRQVRWIKCKEYDCRKCEKMKTELKKYYNSEGVIFESRTELYQHDRPGNFLEIEERADKDVKGMYPVATIQAGLEEKSIVLIASDNIKSESFEVSDIQLFKRYEYLILVEEGEDQGYLDFLTNRNVFAVTAKGKSVSRRRDPLSYVTYKLYCKKRIGEELTS